MIQLDPEFDRDPTALQLKSSVIKDFESSQNPAASWLPVLWSLVAIIGMDSGKISVVRIAAAGSNNLAKIQPQPTAIGWH